MRNPFHYFNSSPEVIRLTVMMYIRYPLSLRQVEDLLFERGIDICHETVRFWWNRFGPMFAAEIRKRRIQNRSYSYWRWHLDEVFVRINGETHYLWRAVDHEGEVLEVFATKRRDRQAALKFLKRMMKRYGRRDRLGEEVTMKLSMFLSVFVFLSLIATVSGQVAQKSQEELIAEAESAALEVISKHATIKTADGKVLRQGTNDWTCYPGTKAIGPMCNQATWDALLAALQKREPFKPAEFSISYMLAGEGEAIGVSNSDPFSTDPTDAHDWVKEGPHLMIIVPNTAFLEGLSTNPKDPVYVMWKGTPYAHIMVKVSDTE